MAEKNSDGISIVICTKGRLKSLGRCLSSIVGQLLECDEIIVIDNSGSDHIRSMVQSYGVRWINETRPGSAWARNRGYQEAKNQIVAYIDDDCIADVVWLAEMRQPFTDRNIGVVTGSVLGERVDLAVSNLVDSDYSFHRGWKAISYAGSTGTKWSPLDIWRVGVGGTMAWRRSVLAQIGGFDPALGAGTPAGSCEDIDGFRRALAHGATIRYQPSALVWHTHPQQVTELQQMLVRYAVTLGAHAIKMTLEEGCWLALIYLWIDWLEQLSGAARLMFTFPAKPQPRLLARTLLLLPPASILGMARFIRYRHVLRNGQKPNAKLYSRSEHNSELPPRSGVVAAEIEITEDLPREPVLAPVWLLVRLQGRPASRVYVPAGQSIAGVLETQLEEPLRRYL